MLAKAAAVLSVAAEQVHGSSVAVIDGLQAIQQPIPGCDALITDRVNAALLIRTADCLPVFFAHPKRGVVALAHAGWRGLARQLPAHVLAVLWNRYRCASDEVDAAIGPAIRSCCYDVGPEFEKIFGPFVRQAHGRRTCDLAGFARAQLLRAGMRPGRVLDTGLCTACDDKKWYSLRREGPDTGRLTSLIMVKSR